MHLCAYFKRIYNSENLASRRKYKQNIENLQVENFAEKDMYFSTTEEKLNHDLKGTYPFRVSENDYVSLFAL